MNAFREQANTIVARAQDRNAQVRAELQEEEQRSCEQAYRSAEDAENYLAEQAAKYRDDETSSPTPERDAPAWEDDDDIDLSERSWLQ